MSTGTKRTVSVNGYEISYVLDRKNVKNLNLRVRKDSSVYVSAHRAVPVAFIDAFVCSKAEFIRKAMRHMAEKQAAAQPPKSYISGESFLLLGKEYVLQVSSAEKLSVHMDDKNIYLAVKDVDNTEQKRRLLDKFITEKSRIIFAEVLADLYPRFAEMGVEKPDLRIRSMKTRWGSCLVQKSVVTLNKRLIETPKICIEYVMMHELCHFLQADHSPRFYAMMDSLMPDWRARKELLAQSIKSLA